MQAFGLQPFVSRSLAHCYFAIPFVPASICIVFFSVFFTLIAFSGSCYCNVPSFYILLLCLLDKMRDYYSSVLVLSLLIGLPLGTLGQAQMPSCAVRFAPSHDCGLLMSMLALVP
jgi:hypothetical protein